MHMYMHAHCKHACINSRALHLTIGMNTSTISASIPVALLMSGLATTFVGGWYFHSSLVELKMQQQETAQIVQKFKVKVRKQSM